MCVAGSWRFLLFLDLSNNSLVCMAMVSRKFPVLARAQGPDVCERETEEWSRLVSLVEMGVDLVSLAGMRPQLALGTPA